MSSPLPLLERNGVTQLFCLCWKRNLSVLTFQKQVFTLEIGDWHRDANKEQLDKHIGSHCTTRLDLQIIYQTSQCKYWSWATAKRCNKAAKAKFHFLWIVQWVHYYHYYYKDLCIKLISTSAWFTAVRENQFRSNLRSFFVAYPTGQ